MDMSRELIDAAYKLQAAAEKYKCIYEEDFNKKDPVIWVSVKDTGESIFMADSFNSERMKELCK